MGLINRICVHRDEEVGVYGFVFYRDSGWVDVIIDDFLYTRIPKYEELWQAQQDIYHNDKEKYETRARIGGHTLLFSRSTTENESWVPLLEKAYAKLNGDYEAIIRGSDAEAMEALTGGISTHIPIKDILDVNKFWKVLLNPNRDQLFGCSIDNSTASQITGLYTSHSYSVLEALEVNGKRFVRVRNPWGKSEWKGPWSDGSKEWTNEWLARLPELRHKFGDDGEFLMEYRDFLKTWTTVERSRLFDADWKLSSLWINVTSRALPSAWGFGDVSFTFSVTEDSPAAIVLSQLNTRSFDDISGYSDWSADFVVYRKGAPSEEYYARSVHTGFWQRAASVELDDLEAGDYALHVRLDRKYWREKTSSKDYPTHWDFRKLGRVRTQASTCKSIAINFEPVLLNDDIPDPEDLFGGWGLNSLEEKPVDLEATELEHTGGPDLQISEHGSPKPGVFQLAAPVMDGEKPDDEAGVKPEDTPGETTDDLLNSAANHCAINAEVVDNGEKMEEIEGTVIVTMAELAQTPYIVHTGFTCEECKACIDVLSGPASQLSLN
ncbi:unnamed protein product [Rhizoctonia solani]|uniref:Calpain catalytic domain-containing protein n=1 Tax=Rhizoctonia solani TaxID=456999 RepID=A0A8H3CA07_9AGAM|nr:unnamed protein product [Rhizoctonia solani]